MAEAAAVIAAVVAAATAVAAVAVAIAAAVVAAATAVAAAAAAIAAHPQARAAVLAMAARCATGALISPALRRRQVVLTAAAPKSPSPRGVTRAVRPTVRDGNVIMSRASAGSTTINRP
jgi:hypothetical protein